MKLNRFSNYTEVFIMPLYEDKHNAENRVKVSSKAISESWCGTMKIACELLSIIKGGKTRIAFDGWYGVDFDAVVLPVADALKAQGMSVKLIPTHTLFKSLEEMKAYKQPNITDDPGFGYVNSDGKLEELMDDTKTDELCNSIKSSADVYIVYGYGAASEKLLSLMDAVIYCDKTMQSMQWQMWDGEMIPFGLDHPDPDYNWKEFNYCDFYLLYRHKKNLYTKMDYYIEAVDSGSMKMVTRAAYDEIISSVVKQPIKQVQIFQPGPWGAYRYRDLWDVPGLECSAWNKMSGPEMSVVIDFGGEDMLNIPLINLLQYNAEVTGKKVSEKYPDLFPLDIWLDDGYFPEPQPAERISMPIHNHPDSSYVERHFNEPLGRYETYYIAEAYEGANTWMGYYDDCDLEEWERKCRESNNLVPIEDWKKYVCNWKSNVGDLYLIPPGTAHGHGGN